MDQYIDTAMEAIAAIVDGEQNWREKRDKVLAHCKGDNRLEIALAEFVSWFVSEDEEE
jgi:ferritin